MIICTFYEPFCYHLDILTPPPIINDPVVDVLEESIVVPIFTILLEICIVNKPCIIDQKIKIGAASLFFQIFCYLF